jgi:predicted dehydrogenase
LIVVTPRDKQVVERALASKVDVVAIHSPPFMQYDHVMRAIDHGQAVLCNKPFGLNAEQAGAMRDRARDRKVLNFEGAIEMIGDSRLTIRRAPDLRGLSAG